VVITTKVSRLANITNLSNKPTVIIFVHRGVQKT